MDSMKGNGYQRDAGSKIILKDGWKWENGRERRKKLLSRSFV